MVVDEQVATDAVTGNKVHYELLMGWLRLWEWEAK
jgi:hypothetical protein